LILHVLDDLETAGEVYGAILIRQPTVGRDALAGYRGIPEILGENVARGNDVGRGKTKPGFHVLSNQLREKTFSGTDIRDSHSSFYQWQHQLHDFVVGTAVGDRAYFLVRGSRSHFWERN
jgi:hypothetical protein